MADVNFDYAEVLKSDGSGVVASIIAHQTLIDSPLRAVIWSARHRDWVSAPAVAARLLYDDQNFDRLRPIDRPTAERIARQALHVELPDEAELRSISAEGQRMGWDYGPPGE